MSIDVLGQEEDAHETKCEEMCCPNVRQEVGAKTFSFRKAYGHLKMPVAIVAGSEDRLIEAQQSAELHRDIAHSTFRCVPSTGHMVHQTATAEVMSAIDMVATEKKEPVSEIAKAESRHRGPASLERRRFYLHTGTG